MHPNTIPHYPTVLLKAHVLPSAIAIALKSGIAIATAITTYLDVKKQANKNKKVRYSNPTHHPHCTYSPTPIPSNPPCNPLQFSAINSEYLTLSAPQS